MAQVSFFPYRDLSEGAVIEAERGEAAAAQWSV